MKAKELEIINQRKYAYLFQQLSSRGWRTREPRVFDVPVEKPRAVRQIAEIIYGNPIRYRKLAEDVALPDSFVRSVIEAYSSKRPEMDVQTETHQLRDSKADVIAFKQTEKLLS